MRKEKIFLNKNHYVLQTIRRKLNDLPPVQKRIGEYVLSFPQKVIKMSITQLAFEAKAKSEASIVHFYRNLGFSGFHDFKLTIATEIAGKSFYHVYEDITIEDDIKTVKQKIFLGTMKTLNDNMVSLSPEILIKAVNLIENANKIIFLGFASSAVIAMDAYFKFSKLGLNCYFSTDSHVNAVALSNVQEGDVIFCVSHSGETKDVVIPAQRAKPIAKIIALTGFSDSSLGKIADVCITTISEETMYRTDAMVSRIVQMAIIDVLFTILAIKKGGKALEKLRKSRQSLSYLKF